MSVPAAAQEKRRSPAMCNLEPTIHRIVTDLAARMGLTVSGYLRRLILADLKDKGLLPDAVLAKLYLSRQ